MSAITTDTLDTFISLYASAAAVNYSMSLLRLTAFKLAGIEILHSMILIENLTKNIATQDE